MIAELEQCSCGILFDVPMLNNPQFREHEKNGLHRDALGIGICGPCFFGAHQGCEGNRGGNRSWKCKCQHREPPLVDPSEARVHEMTITWSDWLAARRPSEINQ